MISAAGRGQSRFDEYDFTDAMRSRFEYAELILPC